MTCTREDLDLVFHAIKAAISDGRHLDSVAGSGSGALPDQLLVDACGRLSDEHSPVLLQAVGNFTLLCLVRTDIAAMKTHQEMRKLMDL